MGWNIQWIAGFSRRLVVLGFCMWWLITPLSVVLIIKYLVAHLLIDPQCHVQHWWQCASGSINRDCVQTNCVEFAILQMLQKNDVANAHCVYIAPVGAPAEEWYHDWESKFGQRLGVRVVELIGETATEFKLSIAMSSARVWVSTWRPEC
jgi:hypothetical protein